MDKLEPETMKLITTWNLKTWKVSLRSGEVRRVRAPNKRFAVDILLGLDVIKSDHDVAAIEEAKR